MSNDSVQKTLIVSILLCLCCSILVSTSAVQLRPRQEANKILDIRKNLLLSAGLLKDAAAEAGTVNEMYEMVEEKVIDFNNGMVTDSVDPQTYNMVKAAKDPNKNVVIENDIAGIKTRSKYGKVYLVRQQGQISLVVIPIYGKGLWSTLYGFMALDASSKAVKGIGFYKHGETPGLGGEIDNPNWKASWVGKELFDSSNKPNLKIVKGTAGANNEIDGLSGATITSVGVETLVNYWLGDHAYGPFLNRVASGEVR